MQAAVAVIIHKVTADNTIRRITTTMITRKWDVKLIRIKIIDNIISKYDLMTGTTDTDTIQLSNGIRNLLQRLVVQSP